MNQPLEREFDFQLEDLRFISSLVYQKTGIVLGDHKRDMVYSRIARRLRNLKLQTFQDYCALLQGEGGAEEMGNFVNAITTNLTSFFRESHHFDHLRDQVLKPLAAKPPANKKLRIWSSASSSGAEPYSIAMTCLEAIPDIASWDFKILATDIDTGMLQKCKAGEYSSSDEEDIPAPYRSKYVIRGSKPGTIQMVDKLKKLITFKQLNLIEKWPFKGKFDIVFCRNVIIYFDKPTQKKLFDQMEKHMQPNAWLYVGHSENLAPVTKHFQLLGKTIYRKST